MLWCLRYRFGAPTERVEQIVLLATGVGGLVGSPGNGFLNHPFALPASPRYCEAMAEASRTDLDDPTPIDVEEDEETLATIDEGIRDAEAGRTVPMEEVRKLLPKWITASSSRKEH